MGLLDARLSYWLTLISTHSFSSLYPCANVSLFFACPLFSQLLQHFSSIVALIHKEIITRSLRDEQTETWAGINRQTQRPWGGRSAVQRDGVKDKEEVKERQQRRGRDRWGCRDELKRDGAGNRGREGGVIIYQVFGCAWQRRKLISTLCVHQLHSQASQGIPLACLCEAAGDKQALPLSDTHMHAA